MVGAYFRVSSDKQEASGTIENQRNLFLQYVQKNNIPTYKEYIDDGVSGADEDISKRKGLINLLDAIDRGLINTLWLFDLTRLARNEYVYASIASSLKKKNIKLITNAGPIDLNKPSDNLLATILSAIAVYEREMILLRTSLGRKRKMDAGLWVKASIYGYQKLKVDGKTKIEINEEEADVLRYCFQAYLDGKNLRQLRTYLKSKGINNFTNFYQKMKNPVYIGKVKDSEDNYIESKLYKPLIDQETFNKVQSIIKDNGKRWKKQFREATYLGSGIIHCPICDSKFYLEKVKKTYKDKISYLTYYRHHRIRNTCIHNGTSLNATQFDTIMEAVLMYLVSNTDMIKLMYEQAQKRQKELSIDNNNEINNLNTIIENEQKKLDTKLQLIEKALSNGINVDRYINDAKDIQNSINKYKEDIKAIEDQIKEQLAFLDDEIESFKFDFRTEYFKADTPQDKRKIILKFIKVAYKIGPNKVLLVSKYNKFFIIENTKSIPKLVLMDNMDLGFNIVLRNSIDKDLLQLIDKHQNNLFEEVIYKM